ncbi:MAG: ABC transporter permease [Lachnospiraceae bacterium]|nr:ABC transporter permease [Lachnospiraceae bacterium]
MKIRLNPIMKKDIKVTARSMKMAWGLMAYEAILAFLFIISLSVLDYGSSYNYQNIYGELISLFPLIGIAQVSMAALTIPIMTASSISGEKERQTFDIMLTTCLSPRAIVFGKVFSSVAEVMLYVIASIPIMALAFVLGGLSWWTLFLFLVVIFVFATLAGSIGVFCSSISRKSIVSIILAFVGYFLVCFLTVLPIIITMFATRGDDIYDSTIFLLLNPIVFLEEFFMLSMTGESLFSGGNYFDFGFFTELLAHGPLWCIISGICMLGLSMFFMFLAARKIDPLSGKVKKIARKQPIVQSAFIPKEVNHIEAGNEAQNG